MQELETLVTLSSIGHVLLEKLAAEGVDLNEYLNSLAEEVEEVKTAMGTELNKAFEKYAQEMADENAQINSQVDGPVEHSASIQKSAENLVADQDTARNPVLKGALIGGGVTTGVNLATYPAYVKRYNKVLERAIEKGDVHPLKSVEHLKKQNKRKLFKAYAKKLPIAAAIGAGIGAGVGALAGRGKDDAAFEQTAGELSYTEKHSEFEERYAEFLEDPELLKEAAEEILREASDQQDLAYSLSQLSAEDFNNLTGKKYNSEIMKQAMYELFEEAELDKQAAKEVLAGLLDAIPKLFAAGKNLGSEYLTAAKALGRATKEGFKQLTPKQQVITAGTTTGVGGLLVGNKLAKKKAEPTNVTVG